MTVLLDLQVSRNRMVVIVTELLAVVVVAVGNHIDSVDIAVEDIAAVLAVVVVVVAVAAVVAVVVVEAMPNCCCIHIPVVVLLLLPRMVVDRSNQHSGHHLRNRSTT